MTPFWLYIFLLPLNFSHSLMPRTLLFPGYTHPSENFLIGLTLNVIFMQNLTLNNYLQSFHVT